MAKVRRFDPAAIRDSLERLDRIAERHPKLLAPEDEEVSPDSWAETLKEVFNVTPRPKDEESVLVNLRIPVTVMKKIDAVSSKLKKDGISLSKSGVIRYLIDQGIKAQERE